MAKDGFKSVTIEIPADFFDLLEKSSGGAADFVEIATKKLLRELFDEAKNDLVTVSLKIPKKAEVVAKKLGIPLNVLCMMVFEMGAESLLAVLAESFPETEGSC